MSVCVFTAVCEEDAHWIPQYLKEIERLQLPFVMHYDRCSSNTTKQVSLHPLCVGVSAKASGEFRETDKQEPFDRLVSLNRYKWAMAWDIDETYERDTQRKLQEIIQLDVPYVDVHWVNLWEDQDHIRIDGPFSCGHRVKFYNLNYRWKFTHAITNGPKMVDEQGAVIAGSPSRDRFWRYDLTCIHWGMMTEELRLFHKERWDRIYSTALKGDPNPYGFWNHALDKSITPITVKHSYFL